MRSGGDSSGGPMALLAAGAAVVIALGVIVGVILWTAPGAIAGIRGQGELGVGILVFLGIGAYTVAILALDALGDAMAAMGAVAGLSLRKRKAEAEHAEAAADATRAASWDGSGAMNGHRERDGSGTYTGPGWP